MSDATWPTFGRPPNGDADTWTLEGELRQLSPAEIRRAVHHFRAQAADHSALLDWLRDPARIDETATAGEWADRIEAGEHLEVGDGDE